MRLNDVYPAQAEAAAGEEWWGGATEGEAEEILAPEALRARGWMLGAIAGRSAAMQHLFARMRCTAQHFRIAAVEGESGTGKLLVAQTLHQMGSSAAGPFAPHLAADFMESGGRLWNDAQGGLLYLSRVEELSSGQQRQLRDLLERSAHERIRIHASSGPLQIVVGSLQPLRKLSAEGKFRSDLTNHFAAIRFPLPALRERQEDISLLAGFFLNRWAQSHNKPLLGFDTGALRRMAAYPWPGNVRELQGIIGAAAVECSSHWIRPMDLPRLEWSSPGATRSHQPSEDDPNLERAILRHVTHVLTQTRGNKVRAAQMLGISRSTLYRMLEAEGTARSASAPALNGKIYAGTSSSSVNRG